MPTVRTLAPKPMHPLSMSASRRAVCRPIRVAEADAPAAAAAPEPVLDMEQSGLRYLPEEARARALDRKANKFEKASRKDVSCLSTPTPGIAGLDCRCPLLHHHLLAFMPRSRWGAPFQHRSPKGRSQHTYDRLVYVPAPRVLSDTTPLLLGLHPLRPHRPSAMPLLPTSPSSARCRLNAQFGTLAEVTPAVQYFHSALPSLIATFLSPDCPHV